MAEEIAEQIREYENQLADVEQLLAASPTDESLLSLKSDLEELLSITKQSLENEKRSLSKFEPDSLEKALEAAVETSVGQTDPSSTQLGEQDTHAFSVPRAEGEPAEPIKTSKKAKEFQIPDHLIPRDNDTEAEKNRKRRAIKTLKSKHRQEMKEIESKKKQKSWQSFQKKRKTKDKSIFSTSQDEGTKVGVVATMGRQSGGPSETERKRHKY
jgi:hypothetical protein